MPHDQSYGQILRRRQPFSSLRRKKVIVVISVACLYLCFFSKEESKELKRFLQIENEVEEPEKPVDDNPVLDLVVEVPDQDEDQDQGEYNAMPFEGPGGGFENEIEEPDKAADDNPIIDLVFDGSDQDQGGHHVMPFEGTGEGLGQEKKSGGELDKGRNEKHSPYVLIGDIIQTMPPTIPQSERENPPSYIKLCKAFIEKSEAVGFVTEGNYVADDTDRESVSSGGGIAEEMRSLAQEGEGEEGGLNENLFYVVEDKALCEDWQAPHFSTLAMYASSLIAAVGRPLGLRYKHDCRRHMLEMRNSKHYDWTPIQSLLPNNLIAKTDAEKIGSEQIKSMCQDCISKYETNGLPEFMSSTTHHCLMMPENDVATSLLNSGKELPMTYALPSMIDRMRHVADDWIATTGYIKNEDETGVVIALDGRSTMMNYKVYDSIIPTGVKSIQIFASSSCGIDYVESKTDCIEHGRRLKRYFINTRSSQYGTYVRYDVVGSTAASFSRMVNSRILICPPGTISCLLPALAKKAGKKAYIAEDPSEEETFQWMEDHLLKERKRLGFQEVGYDAVPDADYLNIISDVDLDMPLEAIGENENEPSHHSVNEFYEPNEEVDYTEWEADGRAVNNED